MVGTQHLTDRYGLDERIALGGMGAVYIATDTRLDRRVAIKLLKPELMHDPRFVERFRREARAAAALSHPSIAAVYDYGEDDGRHFIVMEYVLGQDLARALRADGPLPPDRAITVAAQICDGLAHAHSAGVVHRDIKPANIILGDDDRVKVTDFGISRAAGDSTLTATGSMMGTAHYMSPEQARGGPITPASDLYSLGIVLYEMLTGAVPFVGDTPVSIAMRHVSDDVPPPSAIDPDVPPELDAVVAGATAKDPLDRFADASAMGSALRHAAQMDGVTTPLLAEAGAETDHSGTIWPIPGDRWDPQRLGRIVLVLLGALVAIAATLLTWRLLSDDDPGARVQGGGAAVDAVVPSPTDVAPGFDMPDLVGKTSAYAMVVLADFQSIGIEIDTETVAPSELGLPFVEEGLVLQTDPSGEDRLFPRATVTVWLSSGESNDDDEQADDHGNGKDKDKKDNPGHSDEEDED